MSKAITAIILLGIALLSAPASAQQEKEIISKLRKALLRSDEMDLSAPFIMRGKVSLSGIEMTGVFYYQNPRYRVELELAGMKFISVQQDSLEWSYNPVEKSHTIKKNSAKKVQAEMERKKTFDFTSKDLLNYKERGYKVKNMGPATVDSVSCHHLRLTTGDDKIDFYISTSTSLVYKVESDGESHIYSRYQRFGDYIYPTFMSTVDSEKRMDLIMPDITLNATIPPGTFDIPQEAFDAVKKEGTELEMQLDMADSVYHAENYEEAAKLYSKIITSHGKIFRAHNGRGLCQIEFEKYYEAVSDFNAALEVVPTSSVALSNRGLAKYYIGDLAGARKDYDASLKNDSTNAYAYRNRGRLLFNQKEYGEATKDYAKALQLRPTSAQWYYDYGIALAQTSQYEKAISAYQQAMQLGVRTAGIHNHRGVSYYKIQKYDSAATAFQKSLSMEAENLQYMENYGNTLYQLEKYTDAQKQFENYVSLKKDNAEVYNMIGLCKYREEDYSGAILAFSKSIEVNPKNATYFDNRASAKEQVEDYEGAIVDYSTSITIYPNDADTFYKRGLVKIRISKKLEGCMDLGTANEMKHEGAKEAILKNCN